MQPRRFADVAVLYCDISGFTTYCDSNDPVLVVQHLQNLVEEFESLTASFGLEKLKTVGDALIATAGLLTMPVDPLRAALECGLAAIRAARDGPAGWVLRCGVHIGPVVAGVFVPPSQSRSGSPSVKIAFEERRPPRRENSDPTA